MRQCSLFFLLIKLSLSLSHSPRFSLPPVTLSRLSCRQLFSPSQSSPDLSLWPAWAYCPARRHSLSFSFPPPSFFFCPPLLSPSPSALPFPAPIFSQGVCPKWLRPTWQHLFVVLAQSGRSSPCRAPITCFTFLGTPLTTCSCVSHYPLPYICWDPFLLLIPDDRDSEDQPVAYCPAHPPELVNSLTTLSPPIFFKPLRSDLCLLPFTKHLSHSQLYLLLCQFTHFDLYFHRSQQPEKGKKKQKKTSLSNLPPYLHPSFVLNPLLFLIPIILPASLTPSLPRHRLPCIV